MKKLLSVAFLTCAFAASAKTWYVDPVNGNDAYDGTTSNIVETATVTNGPRRTLKMAAKLLGEGDTLLLLPGEYKEGSETQDGTAARFWVPQPNVTVKSVAGADRTFIVGAGENPADADAVSCAGAAAAGVIFEGITFKNGRSQKYGGGLRALWSQHKPVWAIGCVFTNCVAQLRGGGLYSGSAARCLFVDCGCNGEDGVSADNSDDFENCLFLRGRATDNGKRQVRIGKRFYNCTFYGAVGGVFSNPASYTTRIYNCVSVGNYVWTTDPENGCAGDGYLYLTNSVISACKKWATVKDAYNSQTNVAEKEAGLLAPFLRDCRAVEGRMLDGAGDGSYHATLPAGYEHRDLAGDLVPTSGPVTIGCYQKTVRTTAARFDFPWDCAMEVKGIDHTFPAGGYFYPTNAPWTYMLRAAPTVTKTLYALFPSGEMEETYYYAYHYPLADAEHWIPFPNVRPAGENLSLSAMWVKEQRYVDAENGDDAWDGTSPTRGEGNVGPWKTLAHAGKNTTTPYSIINVAPGVYSNGIATVEGFPQPRRVWLMDTVGLRATEGPEKTFIVGAPDPDGAGASISGLGPNAVAGVGTQGDKYPFVQGFTVTGCYTTDSANDKDEGAAFWGYSRRFQVLDCVISNNFARRTAVMRSGRLLRCRVFGNKANLFQISNARAYGCVFRGNEQGSVGDDSSNATAYNSAYYACTIDCGGRCRPNALLDQYSMASHLYGCVVVNAYRYSAETNWFDTVFGGDCDPALADVANGDYRLGVLSPAIGKFDWTALPNGTDSLNGKRYVSTGLDGKGFLTAANGCVAAGAVQEAPLPCITISGRGQETVTGGKLGTNVVTSASAKITVTASAKRPLVGYAVNGVTNEQAGASYEIAAQPGSSVTVVRAVYGTEWYVDAVNGNDANGGGTLAGAKKKICTATTNAEGGDVIRVAPGTYGEQEGAQRASSENVRSRVVIPARVAVESIEGPERTIIVGAADTLTPDDPLTDVSAGYGTNAIRCVTALAAASIRGFTLTGGYTSSDKSRDYRDLRGSAFWSYTGGGATVEDCIVSNNYAYGGTLYDGIVRKCRIFGNETLFFESDKPFGGGSAALSCDVYDSVADRNRGDRTFRSCPIINNCTIGKDNVSLNANLNPQIFFSTVNGYSMTGTAVLGGRISTWAPQGATPIVVAVTNCVINANACSTDIIPEALRCNSRFVAASQLQVDADYRPVRGSFAGLDMNEPTAEELTGTDIYGTQRVMNARTDAGAVEYDWRGDYGTLLGRDVTVTEASPLVEVLEGTRQLKIPASCSVVATVADPGERRIDVAVSGGTLTVKAGETTIGTYTADARVILTPNGEPLTFAFAADSGVADASASIGRIGRTGGVIMIVR